MNEFLTYKSLCDLSDIAAMYSAGKDLSDKIRDIADRATTNHYKVAVIGEFKRGKSSLINALVGTELMPTDILPMTAVNTHLTYSDKQEIIIYFKDGTTQQSSLEQLIDFATKYDSEKEMQAQLINRVEVHYPSVFCKNHIEIIDTPGLNDNEEMTRVTLNVLGEIDAAIMVISARAPLSETEQHLILSLIEEQGIHHIVFVVTHIDTISDEPSEQDRLIEFIKTRISTKLLDMAKDKYSQDKLLYDKAVDILEKPDVFGVSSLLAIQGFNYDDNKKIKLSRFTQLKHKLLAILTAAQHIDTKLNCIDFAQLIINNIDEWKDSDVTASAQLIDKMSKLSVQADNFSASYTATLTKEFLLADEHLIGLDIPVMSSMSRFSRIRNDVIKIYINEISKLTSHTDTREELIDTLKKANDLSIELIHNHTRLDEETVVTKLINTTEKLISSLESNDDSIIKSLSNQANEWFLNNSFPVMGNIDDIDVPHDHRVEIIAYIKAAVDDSFKSHETAIINYIASWRAMLFSVFEQYKEHITSIDTKAIIQEATDKKNKILFHHNNNKATLNTLLKELNALEE